MPRLIKYTTSGIVDDIPDTALAVVEHGTLFYLIDQRFKGTQRLITFIAAGAAYEFLIQTLNKLPLLNIKLITKEQRQLQRELMSYEDTIMRIVRLKEEELKATIQTSLANKKTQEEAKKTFNIFESHHKLVKAVEDAEKRRTERLIKGNRNIFEEQKKIEELFKPDRTAFEGFKE